MIEKALPGDELPGNELDEALSEWRVAVARRCELQERLKLVSKEAGETGADCGEHRIDAALHDLASSIDSLQYYCEELEGRVLLRLRRWLKALFWRWANKDLPRVTSALGAVQVTLSELVAELDSNRSRHEVEVLRSRYREAELEARVTRLAVEVLRGKIDD